MGWDLMNDCCLLHAWLHTPSHHIGEEDVGKIGGVCRCVSSRLKWKGQARVEVGCSIFSKRFCLKGTNTQHIVLIWVNIFQTELMVEIYSKSLVRAISKVLLVKFS